MSCPSCNSKDVVQKYQGVHLGNYCGSCGRWLTWVPQGWKTFVWPVGSKHKGQTLASILLNDKPYVVWASENLSGTLQKRAQEALESTKGSQPVSKALENRDVLDKIEEGFKREQPKPDNNDLPW